MRHNTFDLSRVNQLVVDLKRGEETLSLKVSPLPFGYDTTFSKMIKRPSPPVRNIIEKGQPRKEVNENDPAYLAALDEYETLQYSYMFYLALRNETELMWDNNPTNEVSVKALKEEIISSGFSAQEVSQVIAGAIAAGKSDPKEVDKDF